MSPGSTCHGCRGQHNNNHVVRETCHPGLAVRRLGFVRQAASSEHWVPPAAARQPHEAADSGTLDSRPRGASRLVTTSDAPQTKPLPPRSHVPGRGSEPGTSAGPTERPRKFRCLQEPPAWGEPSLATERGAPHRAASEAPSAVTASQGGTRSRAMARGRRSDLDGLAGARSLCPVTSARPLGGQTHPRSPAGGSTHNTSPRLRGGAGEEHRGDREVPAPLPWAPRATAKSRPPGEA